MIVVQQLMDSGQYREVGRVEDGEITQGEEMLLSLDDEENWTDMDEERLAFRHDGPDFVAAIVDDAEGGVEAADRGLHNGEDVGEAHRHGHHCALELSHVKNDKWLGWEDCLFELHHGVAYGEANKRLGEIYETNVPDFVKDLVVEAAMDELFSDFEVLGQTNIMSLRSFFAEQLKQDGWTTDKMANELRRLEPTLTPDEAERMTRTETQAIINGAREDGYEATGMIESEKFYWVGSLDDRTTDACKWLIGGASAADNIGGAFKGTNPNEGGIPRTLPKLKELVQKAADKDPDIETEPREFTPHINCRKTYVRDV